MKNTFKNFVSLLLIFTVIFAFAACGPKGNDNNTTEPTTAVVTDTVATTGENKPETTGTSTTDAKVDPTVTETSKSQISTDVKLPQGKAEILAAYTEIMNYAKTAKPAFKKIEYQVLPADKRNFDSGIVNTLLKLASGFMVSEEEAREKPEDNQKGGSMRWFPVYKCDKGCLLTDTSVIKSADCVKLSNGNFKITIVLKEEKNAEPYNETTKSCPSFTGKMFSPLAKADIDKEVKGISVIKRADYSLKYYDCKAVLVYNPANKHIVTLDQYMSTLITLSGKIVLLPEFSGTAVLNNTMNIYDIKY